MLVEWEPSIKHYPHFDKSIRLSDIKKLVGDPKRVASNSFYPFLLYEKRHQPFRKQVATPDKKKRPIRFASRRDAYIYGYYRCLLAAEYELKLAAAGLDENVIAYRKIRSGNGRGKSNIEFARDAFSDIQAFGNAGVVTLDISKFFKSISHKLLYERWCWLLGVSNLPADHAAIFTSITKYAVVDRTQAYERLGFIERKMISGKERLVYKIPFSDMPRQLCSNKDFREKICGKGGKYPSLIERNHGRHGITQGSPISDLLANVYLFDFDVAMKQYVLEHGGRYYRYSDDIILIMPGGQAEAEAARDFATSEIQKHGSKLKIKPSKTSVMVYSPDAIGQKFTCVAGSGKNGIEYLGFRFDGKVVRIRDATLSGLYRKIILGVRAEVHRLIRRYSGKDTAYLRSRFDYAKFMQNYGRVEDFDPNGSYDSWTFWTYARRALKTFGQEGAPIAHQLKNYRNLVRSRVERETVRALV
jgi:hypothetical protein